MKRFKLFAIIGLIIVVMTSCETNEKIKVGEGFLDIKGGKIWYRVVGEGNKTPILMLHGGPGYPSHYLNDLIDLAKERPIITFDQLGCGRSDAIADTTLMTIDNYVDQTNKLLSTLGVSEFYLYGHSWGTMLGLDYYIKYPSQVKGLILASPCLSSQIWERDSDLLISEMPDSIQVVLRNNIQGIPQDSAKLSQAVGMYWDRYYIRKQPTSANFDSTVAQVGWNVYQYMWGENDFFVGGTLKDYNRISELSTIKVPTLFVGGEYDVARPSTLNYYQSLTPDSKTAVIKNAGHVTMNDNPDDNVKAISDFLNQIEKD